MPKKKGPSPLFLIFTSIADSVILLTLANVARYKHRTMGICRDILLKVRKRPGEIRRWEKRKEK